MQQKDPGIKLDHVMSMKSPLGYDANKFDQQYQSFKDHLLSYPSIREVGFSRNIPGNSLEPTGPVTLDDKTFSFGFYRNFIEPDYLSTYEIPILARAKISLANDSRYAFVNRKVVDLLGFKDPSDILRKHLEIYGWNIEIIGVTENFHQQSLHHPIVPTIFDFTGKESASVDGYISIQYDPGQNTSMLNHWIKEAYHQFFPLTVYESIPVQESYFQQYRWDLHFQRISILFTLIALCIGCTGLWALSLLLIQQRLREVCVRKILGASIRSIVYLFAHDFLLVIILSMAICLFSLILCLNPLVRKLCLSYRHLLVELCHGRSDHSRRQCSYHKCSEYHGTKS